MTWVQDNNTIRHSNAVAAGATTITPSSGIDMNAFSRCTFLVEWGTIVSGGVQSIEIHQSSDDGVADSYTALTGTNVSVADDDDNKVTIVEILNPRERYVKCIVNRATQNSTVDSILAIQSEPKTPGAVDDSTVSGTEAHASPAEGAA